VLISVRIAYVVAQVIIFGVYYYIAIAVRLFLTSILSFVDNVPIAQVKRQNDLALLKYGMYPSFPRYLFSFACLRFRNKSSQGILWLVFLVSISFPPVECALDD
jgi:hypothetical protein